MQIDFSQPMTDFAGNQINERMEHFKTTEERAHRTPGDDLLTLGRLCAAALNNGVMEERTFKVAMERYELAKKLYEGGTQDLKAAQVTVLQDLLAKQYPPVIVGQAGKMLETPAETPAAKE